MERLKKHTDQFHLSVYFPKQNDIKCKFCDEWFHIEKSNQHLKLYHKDIVIPNLLRLTWREENRKKSETKKTSKLCNRSNCCVTKIDAKH